MSAPHPPQQKQRLHQLESLETQISSALTTAGQALQELSKDKPSNKQVDTYSTSFLKTLQSVENGLSKHISYLTQVSTGQPHEGSSYAAQKDLQMAFHRLEHVRSRLGELDRMKSDRLQSPQTGLQRSVSQSESAMHSIQRTFSGSESQVPMGPQRSMSFPEGSR